MRFSEIPGQQAIKEKLIQTVTSQRVSHAQLFYGPESSAKLALAIAYAQYINCKNRKTGIQDAGYKMLDVRPRFRRPLNSALPISMSAFGRPRSVAI